MSNVTTNSLSFTITDEENLLQALERTGHYVEYQCREGYCGSCRTTIVKGNVVYTDIPLAYIASNEILPCCCTVAEDIELICNTVGSIPD